MLLSDLFNQNDKAYNISGTKPYLWKRVIHSDFGGDLLDSWAKPIYPIVTKDLDSRNKIPDTPLFARIICPKKMRSYHAHAHSPKNKDMVYKAISIFVFSHDNGQFIPDPQVGLPYPRSPEWEMITGIDELTGMTSIGWAESSDYSQEVLDGFSMWDKTCSLFQDALGRGGLSDNEVLTSPDVWIEMAESLTDNFKRFSSWRDDSDII